MQSTEQGLPFQPPGYPNRSSSLGNKKPLAKARQTDGENRPTNNIVKHICVAAS